MPTEVLEKQQPSTQTQPKQKKPSTEQKQPQKPPPEQKHRDPGKRRRIPGKSKTNKPAKTAEAEPPNNPQIKFLSKQEVLRRIPITGPTLWHWSRTGRFPQPRFIGNRTVWIESEVDEWMHSRPTRNYKSAEDA
jgi:predicted DNA-binding transcriptional regulator AlpA